MVHHLKHLLVIVALALPLSALRAQDGAPRVADDLCSCISRIDGTTQGHVLSNAVSNCLEDAVVHHPGEVLSLLERAPKQGTRAYQLGVVLGSILQRDCPAFRAVQLRLRDVPVAVPVSKRGT